MKLFPKIIGIGVVGLVTAMVIALVAIYCAGRLSVVQSDLDSNMAFRTALLQAKCAHISWLRNINVAIVYTQPEVKIGTDGKLCAFGKWYYSEGGELVQHLPQEIQRQFQNLEKDHLRVHELGGDLIKIWNTDDLGPSIALLRETIEPQAEVLINKLDGLLELLDKEVITFRDQGTALVRTQRLAIWSALAIGAVVLFLYSWIIASSIVNPMKIGGQLIHDIAVLGDIEKEVPQSLLQRKDEVGDLVQNVNLILLDSRDTVAVATELASGNWTRKVQQRSDIDRLNLGMENMIQKINNALHEINDCVKQVAAGSGEVSNASQSLSNGAQEAAASLEQITASMSEISSQTKANAESATQARDLAQKASKAAGEGQGAMLEMTGAMEMITKNSSEIQRVIKVIDDIAFQTNLLALNAAVEAARAGQHGKGFAVVAEEVRNLASRSAKAAQETGELIAKSGHEIEKGGQVAARTAEVLNTVVEQIKQTTDLIAGIAVASNEQAEGVNQVTIGLQQIDAVTQQNTASAEESASAANEMSGMASNLQKLVAQFKLR